MNDKKKYGTIWKENPDLIPIGGRWVYAIGIVQDKRTGNLRVRIAKGRIKGYTKRNERGELEVHPQNPNDPITQPNRLNIKTLKEWETLNPYVKKWLEQLRKENEKK